MTLGPVMLDLHGPVPEDDERELLKHPLVGGVILFARNYEDPRQLGELTREIHGLRNPPLLIATDHEGGRVQRFHEGFTMLPACCHYGEVYDDNRVQGLELARRAGWLMAVELLAVGVDFSFAPVLDLGKGISQVIGDRAFHRRADAVAVLAKQFMQGMKEAGMAAVGKHFPGHGAVREDSHHAVPLDRRRFEDIAMDDMIPFERLISDGLPAVMPAHVIYPEVDDKPAGFSAKWLDGVLRRRLGFQGAVFSDDISMAGAEVAGDYPQRAGTALAAGCDMVLICNNRAGAMEVLDRLDTAPHPASSVRLMRMHGRGPGISLADLAGDENWRAVSALIAGLDKAPELGLGDDEIKS